MCLTSSQGKRCTELGEDLLGERTSHCLWGGGGHGWDTAVSMPRGSPRAAGHQTLPKSVLSGLGKETASYLTSVTVSSARRDTVALQGTSPSLRTLEMTLQRLDIPISQV